MGPLALLCDGWRRGGRRARSGDLDARRGRTRRVFYAPWSESSADRRYAIGAGFEYAFADNWSARVEYLFLNQSLNTQIFDNGQGFQYASRTRNENHILRFGLNYHFGEKIGGAIEDGKRRTATTAAMATQAQIGDAPEQYSVHAQTTGVAQGYPKFPRALQRRQQLSSPKGQARVGSTTNLFFGLRLWEGAAVLVNPEIDQGYGLANSVGAASYPNSAVAKVGRAAPYMRFQRYFLRQIIGFAAARREGDPDDRLLQRGARIDAKPDSPARSIRIASSSRSANSPWATSSTTMFTRTTPPRAS